MTAPVDGVWKEEGRERSPEESIERSPLLHATSSEPALSEDTRSFVHPQGVHEKKFESELQVLILYSVQF